MNEIKILLDKKNFDINQIIEYKYGLNALCAAAMLNRHAIIEYLLFRGSEINAKDRLQQTPLMHATNNWHFYTIKLLIENGANILLS